MVVGRQLSGDARITLVHADFEDAPWSSKSRSLRGVRVRPPPPAPNQINHLAGLRQLAEEFPTLSARTTRSSTARFAASSQTDAPPSTCRALAALGVDHRPW